MGCGNSTAGGAGGRGATGTTKDVTGSSYFNSKDFLFPDGDSLQLQEPGGLREDWILLRTLPEQKNLYQMMTKGGTTVVCMLVCHQMRLPWYLVRRKLHQKKEINTARSKQLEQSSAKTICQCFSESCLSAEDFYIYIAFQRAKQIRAPKNLNCCKFQLRVKLKVQH
ncbi:overexpressed in colon carcinoma 1 protein isoform X2 [Cygnus atratus]|uniref:overexpressed in colon carcinoma 1 protein isoform X2 n=1 Tax=Cygnus atratus TaxID=8868 RepID=UPI0015D5F171|nr:overexpressed in colon carcinoma 1 protein isoform X2 [Cygnus atratus]